MKHENFHPLLVFGAILKLLKKIITISLYKLRTQQYNFSLIHWLIFIMFYVLIDTASALNFPM